MSRGATATAGVQSQLEAHLQSLTDGLATVEHQLWAFAVLAAAIDVWLTYAGLQVGLTEGNPLMAALMHGSGVAALASAKLVVLGVAVVGRVARPVWGPWLSLGLALPWAVAAGINAVLLALV